MQNTGGHVREVMILAAVSEFSPHIHVMSFFEKQWVQLYYGSMCNLKSHTFRFGFYMFSEITVHKIISISLVILRCGQREDEGSF